MIPVAPEYQTHPVVELRPIVIEVKRKYKDPQFFANWDDARAAQLMYGGLLVRDQIVEGRWILIFIPEAPHRRD